jgi:cold shock CspA family protein
MSSVTSIVYDKAIYRSCMGSFQGSTLRTKPARTVLHQGSKDVLVHISAGERAGLNTLNDGAKLSYEEKENRGKISAENLRVG